MSIVDFVDLDATTAGEGVPQPGSPAELSDAELLRRFLADRDDLAFTWIVTRHGPLVLAVCRRILRHEQDAEDAFQATFLVLARKAASVRRGGSLAAWLHQTAFRLALRAKAGRKRRRELPLEAENMIATETLSHITTDYNESVLDEELERLPDKYRLPLFLCCVEGKSRDQAAEQLGWSHGSLKGRLERGRQLLRRRLMLRRVSPAVVMAMVLRSHQTAVAARAVNPSLLAATVKAAVQYATGESVVGCVSQNVLSLANGSLRVMSLTTSKLLLCSLMGIGLFAWATSRLPAPAYAGGDEVEGQVLMLQTEANRSPAPATLVAFAADKGESSRRSPEAEAGPRRSPEAEAGPRRSPEAEAGPRRSPEAEAGPRRSPEAEAGPRRSPEAEAGPRRSPEAEAGPRQSPEAEAGPRQSPEAEAGPRRSPEAEAGPRISAEGRRQADGDGGLSGFRPQTEREAALYQMILQLQRELAQLKREVYQLRRETSPERSAARGGETPSRIGPRDGEGRRTTGSRDNGPASPPENWERSKEGNVFEAYDKNGDLSVTLDEWLKMKPGSETDPARRQLETRRFNEAEPGGDGKFTVQEFLYWYTKGRFQDLREGRATGPRDGEGGGRSGPRDGEGGTPRGPRDRE